MQRVDTIFTVSGLGFFSVLLNLKRFIDKIIAIKKPYTVQYYENWDILIYGDNLSQCLEAKYWIIVFRFLLIFRNVKPFQTSFHCNTIKILDSFDAVYDWRRVNSFSIQLTRSVRKRNSLYNIFLKQIVICYWQRRRKWMK